MLKDDSQLEENLFDEYLEWAEEQNALIAQERSDRMSRAQNILQGDKNIHNIVALQDNIVALIDKRDSLLKQAGYEKMGDGDISWWGRKDLDFVQMEEDQMPPGASFPTYY